MATDLCRLAIHYVVDKCPHYHHTYTPQYHALLSPIRNDIKLLLEIGIGNVPLMQPITNSNYKPGASLRMWRDYFPNAKIVGCDILENVQFTENNITTFITDQSNVESLNQLIQNVSVNNEYADVIIDDGSHQEAHMAISFKELWKFVKPSGGIYIIEDIQLPFFNRIVNLPKEFGFTDASIKQSYNGNGYWDNFVAFEKH